MTPQGFAIFSQVLMKGQLCVEVPILVRTDEINLIEFAGERCTRIYLRRDSVKGCESFEVVGTVDQTGEEIDRAERYRLSGGA